MPEWSKGVDLRSTGFGLVGSNPTASNFLFLNFFILNKNNIYIKKYIYYLNTIFIKGYDAKVAAG